MECDSRCSCQLTILLYEALAADMNDFH
jgi:hypothetical protein